MDYQNLRSSNSYHRILNEISPNLQKLQPFIHEFYMQHPSFMTFRCNTYKEMCQGQENGFYLLESPMVKIF